MITSTYPDIPIPNTSIFDTLFGDITAEDRDRVALIDGASGAELSFGALIDGITAFAGALAARGVAPGDVVGLLSPNRPDFATAFHGILRAGATATTINALYTAGEIEAQLRDAGATVIVTVSALLPHAAPAAAALGIDDDHVIVLDGADGHPDLAELIAEGRPAPEIDIDPATHLAVLPYSSGTTGRPKGVMLTHRNLVANMLQCRDSIGIGRDDRALAVLPFFHIYGLTVLLNYALLCRASLVTMARFDLPEFLRIIAETRCTWIFIAPPIAVALAKHPLVAEADLSAVAVVFSGAAPLDRALAEQVEQRLGCVVCQGYGMTETSPVTHAVPPNRRDIDRSSVGLLLSGTEARVVDPETGADLTPPEHGASEPGELWIRGPQVMSGYLGNAEASAEALTADGWLRTGDIGTVTADGVFAIVDRLKELIKYKGYQVAPAVLEAILLGNPEIADAAVIGSLDEDGQEIPHAFVVIQPGSAISADEVMAFVTDRVAPHERVRRVTFVDTIPKSASGKILRRELRAAHA